VSEIEIRKVLEASDFAPMRPSMNKRYAMRSSEEASGVSRLDSLQ